MEKAFQRSFDNLNLDYIDLYLLHYPVAYQRVLRNNRLPSDDVNAFHLFPVDKMGMGYEKCVLCHKVHIIKFESCYSFQATH